MAAARSTEMSTPMYQSYATGNLKCHRRFRPLGYIMINTVCVMIFGDRNSVLKQTDPESEVAKRRNNRMNLMNHHFFSNT
jgi:hypothetical protein